MLITTPLTPGAPLRANYHPPLITQGSSPAPPAAPPAAAGHRNPPPGGWKKRADPGGGGRALHWGRLLEPGTGGGGAGGGRPRLPELARCLWAPLGTAGPWASSVERHAANGAGGRAYARLRAAATARLRQPGRRREELQRLRLGAGEDDVGRERAPGLGRGAALRARCPRLDRAAPRCRPPPL